MGWVQRREQRTNAKDRDRRELDLQKEPLRRTIPAEAVSGPGKVPVIVSVEEAGSGPSLGVDPQGVGARDRNTMGDRGLVALSRWVCGVATGARVSDQEGQTWVRAGGADCCCRRCESHSGYWCLRGRPQGEQAVHPES